MFCTHDRTYVAFRVGDGVCSQRMDMNYTTLTLQEAAERLGISLRTAQRLAKTDGLPGQLPRLGNASYRFSPTGIDEYLASYVRVGS